MMNRRDHALVACAEQHVAGRKGFPLAIIASLFALSTILVLSARASHSGVSARGKKIRVRDAGIVDIERVKLPSAAPAGAVVGGFKGLVLSCNKSTGRQLATGIGGAAFGGLATAAPE